MSLRSGLRQLRCLISAFWLCLFTGPLATTESIASDEPVSTHHHERSAATQHEPVYEKLPPSGLSPEEDLEYSRFMHHSSGVTVLVIGALLLVDRWTAHRHRLLRVGSGLTWLAFGAFLFVFSDLEAWPIGPAGFSGVTGLHLRDVFIPASPAGIEFSRILGLAAGGLHQ